MNPGNVTSYLVAKKMGRDASAAPENRTASLRSSNFGGDDLTHVLCAGLTADVASANVCMRQDLEDGLFNRISCLLFAEMFQHHCARPDLGDRIRNPLARDVRSRSMHWLKEGRIFPLRVEVGGRRKPH